MAEYIPTPSPVIHFTATGTQNTFNIPFPFLDENDIKVYIELNEQLLGINYSVTGNSVEENGIVNLFITPVSGTVVTVIRDTVEQRLTDFETAARFDPSLLDSEFNNVLRMVEDTRLLNTAAPTFHPRDIGNVNGVLPQIIPKGVLRFNEDGDGFDILDLNDVPEFADSVALAQGYAQQAQASATSAEDDRILAEDAQEGSNTAYLGAELAKEDAQTFATKSERYATFPEDQVIPTTSDYSALHYAAKSSGSATQAQLIADSVNGAVSTAKGYRDETLTYRNQSSVSAATATTKATEASDSATVALGAQQGAELAEDGAEFNNTESETNKNLSASFKTLSEQYATYPVDQIIPTTSDYSAKHYAAKAMEAASASLIWGGGFTPTAGQEYPTTTGITQDTQWVIELSEDYTYTSGVLVGKTTKAGDLIIYDTPNNTWTLVSINRAPERNRKITFGSGDAPTTGVREEGEIYFKLLS